MPKVSTFTTISSIAAGSKVPLLAPAATPSGYIQRLVDVSKLINATGGNIRVSANKLQMQADDGLWYDITLLRSQGYTTMDIGQTGSV